MVLRSGCIIPFQFRDNKKLLMIGVPEENRNLSIWDLKNVVRAAFGVYNFEFRNKKIGFIIPDELLLNYLAQRHDLTNFVIEVGQVKDKSMRNKNASFDSRCSQKLNIQLSQKSDDSVANEYTDEYVIVNEALSSPRQGNNLNEPPNKIRISQAYTARLSESPIRSMDQSIDIMDKVEDSVCFENEMDFKVKEEIPSTNYSEQNLSLTNQTIHNQHKMQQILAIKKNPHYSQDDSTNEQLRSTHSPVTGVITARRFKMFKQFGKVNNKSTHHIRSPITQPSNIHNNPTITNSECFRKKRHSRWNTEEEQVLLELWEKKLPQLRGQKRNGHVYVEIADVMCQNNFDFNAAEIRHKIRNLMNRYKKEKKMGIPSDWPYFEKVKMLLESYKSLDIETVVEESVVYSSSSE
ncbi:uncharacterized protein LOC119669650 isoform X1 [Teleopsis dalmanni]|uniref:uncharacterized protein LOC119669650 isoform X1 n=1 Tax=Teleopsis dalmanni TaxID=139649 RepID=UPI0018CE545A|nr:uncharacterized protein LOC119669650 isoform X1 [Teleopsis dalmanni]